MESNEELQQDEITALKSIYAGDFVESPPPKAWKKNAARLPEFMIKVSHPTPKHASQIFFHLSVKLPKTYPTIACPAFSIAKPMSGLSDIQVSTLAQAIHIEAQKHKGSEMVFQIVTFAQEWTLDHVIPIVETHGSLATEMNQRASEEQRLEKEREAQKIELDHARAAQQASQLTAQIQADAQRQLLARQQHMKTRQRLVSDTIEMHHGDTLIETFNQEIDYDGLKFNAVKVFHPSQESVGVTYLADPVCDDINATLPLELYAVTFTSNYYSTNQGRKKLKQLEAEIEQLVQLRHPNLLSVLAVNLSMSNSSDPPRMAILSEKRPRLSLEDLLQNCEFLPEERASDYVAQILLALNVVHSAGLVHRGINARCIGLSMRDRAAPQPLIKLGKADYFTRIIDLHKSNPIKADHSLNDDWVVPENWLSREIIESPLLYTPARDLHCVGLVLLQMLVGYDVVKRFENVRSALQNSSVSPDLQQHVRAMLTSNKKDELSCFSILANLSELSYLSVKRGTPMPIPNPKTPVASQFRASPEVDYFRPQRVSHTSRWKEDWEELELLGAGAFGSVVKARNKVDSRTYAVKKIRLRPTQSDDKIFREVNALSRLSHRFIVRYYTTWIETSELDPTGTSDISSSESGATGELPSARSMSGDLANPAILGNLSGDKFSFPSIHFERSGSLRSASDDESSGSDETFDSMFESEANNSLPLPTKPTAMARILYIQMEFVERQTLKERIAEGLSENEAWRLFQQIVGALVHISGLGIIHRDIKLTNIFIDAKGDCKVGDFGLATSLAAMNSVEFSNHPAIPNIDMTLEVGTRLYIAPEVQSRKRGPRNHSKADLYSLGIVFFEMNYSFSTDAERIAVLENLRKEDVLFPQNWPAHLTQQRQIIEWLLLHDPAQRPTALELSQSSLLPPRLEDEYFKGVLNTIVKPDAPHYQAILSSMFKQTLKPSLGFLYDSETEIPEHAPLNEVVQTRLGTLFKLHGAVEMEPPLLLPVTAPPDEQKQALFIDRHGDLVMLPNELLVPFARLAVRMNIRRIKRFHIANVYRPNVVSGHPKVTKAAVLDIISPDHEMGRMASAAELLSITVDCLNSFPNLAGVYDVHISHSKIVEVVLDRIPQDIRSYAVDIVSQSKLTTSQKRALLLKRGVLRSISDEIEVLSDADENVDNLLSRLEKVSSNVLALILPFVDEVKQIIQYAHFAGVTKIYFRPLMLGNDHDHFRDGMRFEAVRRNRRVDVLAVGGRYDNLMARHSPPKAQHEQICAFGLQIAIEKIVVALAAYQGTSVKTLVKEQQSFGVWSPRRCDVYIISYHPGYLQDRLETAAHLWQHNISADIMYDSGLPDADHEDHVELCAREGILFIVYPRPRLPKRDQPAYKVKSVLQGTEHEVSRQELVGWLQQQIAEQKRRDGSIYGSSAVPDTFQGTLPSKDVSSVSDVQLVLPSDAKLPGDTKKQRKQIKHLFLDRAFDAGVQLRGAVQSGIPTIAIDVPNSVFELLTKSSSWVTEEEAWKTVSSTFGNPTYAQLVREAVLKKRSQGHKFALLFAVREERLQVVPLQ